MKPFRSSASSASDSRSAAPLPMPAQTDVHPTFPSIPTPTQIQVLLDNIQRVTSKSPWLNLDSRTKSELKGSLAIAFLSLSVAIKLAGMGKFISLLGEDGNAASPIVSAIDGLTAGAAFYFLLSIVYVGRSAATSIELGNMIKALWFLTLILSVAATTILCASPLYLPYIYPQGPAAVAGNVLLGYGAMMVPELFATTFFNIAFLTNEPYIPPTMGAIQALVTLFSGYFLAFNAGLGAFGIGLGSSLASVLIAAGMLFLINRKPYAKYELFNWKVEWSQIQKHLWPLTRLGLQMTAQSSNEWLNTFLIAILMGIFAPVTVLAATQPALVWMMVIGFFLNGFGSALGSFITSRNHENNSGNIKNILITNSLVNVLPMFVIALIFYFYPAPLSNFFLAPNLDGATQALSQQILYIAMFGLMADSVRLITTSILRGQGEDILIPTLLSFLIVSGIGIAAGFGIAVPTGNWSAIFSMRDVTLLLAAIALIGRLLNKKPNATEAPVPANNSATITEMNTAETPAIEMEDFPTSVPNIAPGPS